MSSLFSDATIKQNTDFQQKISLELCIKQFYRTNVLQDNYITTNPAFRTLNSTFNISGEAASPSKSR